MKGIKFSIFVMLLMVVVLLVGACQPAVSPPTATEVPPPTETPKLPSRILFIGDSFTYWNEGLDTHMVPLAASANPPMTIEASSVTKGGFDLEKQWEISSAQEAIQEGNWDVVVLQEDLAMYGYDEQEFYEYARKFDEEIKNIEAQTVLYMPWEYNIKGTKTTEDIARAYNSIGVELEVRVAPVGLAWARSIQERPDLDLYGNDKVHPSVRGTYLTLCVLYATIFEQSPVGLSYQLAEQIDKDSEKWEKWQLTEDELAFLQRIAWETVVDYQAEQ